MFTRMEKDARQRALFRVSFHCDLAETVDERALAFHREMRSILLTIFRSLAANRGLREPWTPESCASTFAAVVGGLLLHWALERPGFRLAPDGTAMLALVLDSLIAS